MSDSESNVNDNAFKGTRVSTNNSYHHETWYVQGQMKVMYINMCFAKYETLHLQSFSFWLFQAQLRASVFLALEEQESIQVQIS